MKSILRYLILISTVSALFCLSSCDHLENTEYQEFEIVDDIEVHKDAEAYPIDFSEITFRIENRSDSAFSYSEANVLEFNKNGTWKIVPNANEGYVAVAYTLNSQCTINMSIHSSNYDFKFQEGEYRFIIPVHSYDVDDGIEKQIVFYFNLDEE